MREVTERKLGEEGRVGRKRGVEKSPPFPLLTLAINWRREEKRKVEVDKLKVSICWSFDTNYG